MKHGKYKEKAAKTQLTPSSFGVLLPSLPVERGWVRACEDPV
jgi:hypothetical protein